MPTTHPAPRSANSSSGLSPRAPTPLIQARAASRSGRDDSSANRLEVLDLMDRMQRDPVRRVKLASSWEIYLEAIACGLIDEQGIDHLARCMNELVRDGLIEYGMQSGGAIAPPMWDGAWLQQLHDWRVTPDGRADAALFRQQRDDPGPQPAAAPVPSSTSRQEVGYDIFIAHAGADKEAVARPLAAALRRHNWAVWLDELELSIGDSLEGRISAALARTRFGVVVLSPAFFAGSWPQRELHGLPPVRWPPERRSSCPFGTELERPRFLSSPRSSPTALARPPAGESSGSPGSCPGRSRLPMLAPRRPGRLSVSFRRYRPPLGRGLRLVTWKTRFRCWLSRSCFATKVTSWRPSKACGGPWRVGTRGSRHARDVAA